MKYIYPTLLIVSALVLGGILLYSRGGGMGLDPWESADNEPSIQLKPNALPALCKVEPLKTPDPAIKQQPNVCVVEFPGQLGVVPYCINRSTKLGAANITLPQGLSHFVNLPKNCTVLVNEEKLYTKSIVCSGPAGSKVSLTVENSCTPPNASLPAEVKPSCPPDTYLPDWTSWCRYENPPNSPPCPQGTHFDSSANCCRANEKDFPWIVRGCPKGYDMVWSESPGIEENTYVRTQSCVRNTSYDLKTDIRMYTIILGNCNGITQGDTDMPVPCTIDPASGTCK